MAIFIASLIPIGAVLLTVLFIKTNQPKESSGLSYNQLYALHNKGLKDEGII